MLHTVISSFNMFDYTAWLHTKGKFRDKFWNEYTPSTCVTFLQKWISPAAMVVYLDLEYIIFSLQNTAAQTPPPLFEDSGECGGVTLGQF